MHVCVRFPGGGGGGAKRYKMHVYLHGSFSFSLSLSISLSLSLSLSYRITIIIYCGDQNLTTSSGSHVRLSLSLILSLSFSYHISGMVVFFLIAKSLRRPLSFSPSLSPSLPFLPISLSHTLLPNHNQYKLRPPKSIDKFGFALFR